ncbi:hypothetical protein TNCV_2135021 [Trichonephila clavipes]|nr:hypothetical protein TNCV_2135021 [Trichonephila clavipes]
MGWRLASRAICPVIAPKAPKCTSWDWPWVAWWLEHWTPGQKVWVRCPMLPNTLRVHTEYVLVKSVGSKVLWAESRMHRNGEHFPPVPWQNCGGGDRWCLHLSSLQEISYCFLYGAQGLGQRQAYF